MTRNHQNAILSFLTLAAIGCGEPVGDSAYYEDAAVCVPECGEAQCGDDGCGGTCGSCDADEDCYDGDCMTECSYCMQESCGAEIAACESNADCVSLLSCMSACSTEDCMYSCMYAYPGGIDDLYDLLVCMDDECDDAC